MDSLEQICHNRKECVFGVCMHKHVHSLFDCVATGTCVDGRCRALTSDEYETDRIEKRGW